MKLKLHISQGKDVVGLEESILLMCTVVLAKLTDNVDEGEHLAEEVSVGPEVVVLEVRVEVVEQ